MTTGSRFRYTGQQYLGPLNLYYYKARFYSPTLGRFLQTDPIGYADDMNLYAYVGNNPINRTDPSGLFGPVGALAGFGLGATSSVLGSIAVGEKGIMATLEDPGTWAAAAFSATAGGIGGFYGNPAAGILATSTRIGATSGVSNLIGQTVTLRTDNNSSNNLDYNIGAVVGATFGGAWSAAITRGAGPVTSAVVGSMPATASEGLGGAIYNRATK